MKTEQLIKYTLLAAIVLFYLVYTLRYAITFKKNILFTGRRKTFHSIAIWIFPFIWIWILKTILKPTPGSSEFLNKKDPDKFNDNTSDWVALSESNDSSQNHH